MENLTYEVIQQYLSKNVLKFKSTHFKLSIPVINRIYKKMCIGIKFENIKICDDLIIDGHHRYISSLLAGIEIKDSPYHKTSATIVYKWEIVDFTNEEWDTEEKILHLNRLDAEYNNIAVEEIIEITK